MPSRRTAQHTAPAAAAEPWRIKASPTAWESSSRCGEFHHHLPAEEGADHEDLWNSIRTGASRTENGTSSSSESVTRDKSAVLFRPFTPHQNNTQQLRQEQRSTMVEANSARWLAQAATAATPGTTLTRLQEVLRFGQGMHHLQRRRQGKEHKPQRRRQVGRSRR